MRVCLQIEELIENDEELVQRVRQFQETIGREPSFGNSRNLVTTSTTHEPETPRAPRRRAPRSGRSPPRKRAMRIWSLLNDASQAAQAAVNALPPPATPWLSHFRTKSRVQTFSAIRAPSETNSFTPVLHATGQTTNVLCVNSNSSADRASSSGSSETTIAVQTHQSSTNSLESISLLGDITVSNGNDATNNNNNYSSKKSSSGNETYITVEIMKSSTKPNSNILLNKPNDVTLTSNQSSKAHSSINRPSSSKGNTSVSNCSTSLYDAPSTSSGYYSTTNNDPMIIFGTINPWDDSDSD